MTEPSQLKQCIKQIIAVVSYGSGLTMNNNKIPLLQITFGKLITHGITCNIAKNPSFFKLKNIVILYHTRLLIVVFIFKRICYSYSNLITFGFQLKDFRCITGYYS